MRHSGLYLPRSYCKLPDFLFSFFTSLMHCLIYFNSQGGFFPPCEIIYLFFCTAHCLTPQKPAISQHHFLFGTQQWRTFLSSSPFTRKTRNGKISCGFNWSKLALGDMGIDLLSSFYVLQFPRHWLKVKNTNKVLVICSKGEMKKKELLKRYMHKIYIFGFGHCFCTDIFMDLVL